MFPERLTFSIADWVNAWVDALVTNYGDLFRKISDTLLWAIVNLEGLLRARSLFSSSAGRLTFSSTATSSGAWSWKVRDRPTWILMRLSTPGLSSRRTRSARPISGVGDQ